MPLKAVVGNYGNDWFSYSPGLMVMVSRFLNGGISGCSRELHILFEKLNSLRKVKLLAGTPKRRID